MGDEQIGSEPPHSELLVRLRKLRQQQLAHDHLAAPRRVHHALVERRVGRIEVRPHACVLDPFALDGLAIDPGGRDDGRVAARLELDREADVREHVAVDPQLLMTMRRDMLGCGPLSAAVPRLEDQFAPITSSRCGRARRSRA